MSCGSSLPARVHGVHHQARATAHCSAARPRGLHAPERADSRPSTERRR